MNLLKCPFCGGKPIIKNDVNSEGKPFYQVKHDCVCFLTMMKTFCYKAEEEAVSAWNRRAQPDNAPLTLDELREMDGQPVWVTYHDGSGARWGIVSVSAVGICAVVADDVAYWVTDVCKNIVYRHKPEPPKEDA